MKKQPSPQVLRDYMHRNGGSWSPVKTSVIRRVIETCSVQRNLNGTPFPEDVAEMELMYAVNCQNVMPYRYMARKWGWGDKKTYKLYSRLGIYAGSGGSNGVADGEQNGSRTPRMKPRSQDRRSKKGATGERGGSNVSHKEIQEENRSDVPVPSLCSGTSLDPTQMFSRDDLDVILRWEKLKVEDEEEIRREMPPLDNVRLGPFGPSIPIGATAPVPIGLGAFGPSITSEGEARADNIEQILSGDVLIPEVSEEARVSEEWSHDLDTLGVDSVGALRIGRPDNPRVGMPGTPPSSHTLNEGLSVPVSAPDSAGAPSPDPSSDNPVRRLLGASDEELEAKVHTVNAILKSYGYQDKIDPVDLWHVADNILRIPRDRIDLAISMYKDFYRPESLVGMMRPRQFFKPEQIEKTITFLNNVEVIED